MRSLRTRTGLGVAIGALALTAPLATVTTAQAASTDLVFDRAMTYVSILPGETVTASVLCPGDFTPTSGGFQLDAGSAGSATDVFITNSDDTVGGRDGWTVTVKNGGMETATGNVRVACIGDTTAGGVPLTVVDRWSASAASDSDGDGLFSESRTCLAGEIPVGTTFGLTGSAVAVGSDRDGLGWTLSFETAGAAAFTGMAVRCLLEYDADLELLEDTTPAKTTAVSGAATAASSCAPGYTALAGEYALLDGGVYGLGDEVTSDTVTGRFYNDGDDSTNVVTDAVCVKGSAIVAPAPTVTVANPDNANADELVLRSNARGKTLKTAIDCSNACGTVNGKVFLKVGATGKGKKIATGKVVTDADGKGILIMTVPTKRAGDATANGKQVILKLVGTGISIEKVVKIW
jgi:hypothetical protein